jgi:hypothetical protein
MISGDRGRIARDPRRPRCAGGRGWNRRALRVGRAVAAALLILTFLAPAVRAQGQAQPKLEKRFSKNAQFKLPLQMGDVERQTLREVHLYVKYGNDNWVLADKVAPTQSHFTFKAPRDGEYWFSIVTIDQAGKAIPADVSREEPALIVVVDTQAPQLDVNVVPSSTGGTVLRCEARDANLAAGTLKVDYQTADLNWMPIDPVPGSPDLFALPADKTATGLVRASVSDWAKNAVCKEFNLKATPPADAVKNDVPPAKVESTSDKLPTAPSDKMPVAAVRHLLNCTRVSLDYQIDQVGPSGVGRVEIWMTNDEGKSWQRLCEDKDRVSPAEFDLPGEGLYGLSVVVTNGNGQGDPPPGKGDQPDYWIEVDTTKPVAQLMGAKLIQGDASGALQITWQANDKNLGADCVNLYYAAQRDGQWLPIAKGLKNDGSYRWSVSRDVGAEFYVCMEVTDKAGNMTRCELQEKVVLDMSRPKAKVLGVSASAPHPPTPPTGN